MQLKADSELVRRQNRRIVLEALRQNGPLARVELGRVTGLSPASITAISSQLIAENVIEELESPFPLPANGKRGRPTVQLGLQPKAAMVLAVNVAIDVLVMAVSDFTGRILHQERVQISTYEAKAEAFGELVAAEINGFLARHNIDSKAIRRIGIAIQGLADSRNGTIAWSPAFQERDIPLASVLEDIFEVPCLVANDANMMAEGLLMFEPNIQGRTTAAIFTGYGVGMGLIINGKVYHGATGGAAEFGHMNHIPGGALCRCGKRGCIEAYAADYGILRAATGSDDDTAPRTGVPAGAMAELMTRAQASDEKAVAAFAGAGAALGYGIGRLVAVLNPDRVVLAGPGLEAQQLMEPALRHALADSVVEELSRNVTIAFVPVETDLIMRGTNAALLRALDDDVSSVSGRVTIVSTDMTVSA
jgi:predicted NBD/HSP70 family sugar kinase